LSNIPSNSIFIFWISSSCTCVPAISSNTLSLYESGAVANWLTCTQSFHYAKLLHHMSFLLYPWAWKLYCLQQLEILEPLNTFLCNIVNETAGLLCNKDPLTDATMGHDKMDILYCIILYYTVLFYDIIVWHKQAAWPYHTIKHTYKNT